MAENFDLIFGQSASQQYAWSDSDYQNGWQTVGSTPPTAEQFDALQRRNDTKAKDLNDRLSPLETKAEADGRQAATEYAEGVMVTAYGLPNGWLLECVVPGTTDTGALVIPSPLVIGGTIVDGTVTWKLLNLAMGGVPVGYVTPFLQSTAPDGWLSCAGAEVSRTAYPDLWAFVNGSSQLISEADWQSKNTAGEKNIGWFSSGDGTTTFRLPRIVGSGELTETKRFTTAGAGSFVAPITGIYRITLQGAGGGGGASNPNAYYGLSAGAGGGQGGHGVFYEKLTAGTAYSFVIGAGGAGGTTSADGGTGGASSIIVNNNEYIANGGIGAGSTPPLGGTMTVNGTIINRGLPGTAGTYSTKNGLYALRGGAGGGAGAGANYTDGINGAGGGGGYNYSDSNSSNGAKGGDGYIEFSFNPVPQFWYVRAFGSATNQGTIDITALANMLNAKLSIADVPKVAGFNAKQTFTSSGTFTAPITGVYHITLQGAGGGGASSSGSSSTAMGARGGGGGGEGARLDFYEQLTAGESYSYTIGAGGSGGQAGSASLGYMGVNGGDSSITINGTAYVAGGGGKGYQESGGSQAGYGGVATIAGVTIDSGQGASGGCGGSKSNGSTVVACGGGGGGLHGGHAGAGAGSNGVGGSGGGGGGVNGSSFYAGGAGGDGYVTFEWQTGSLA